MKEPTSTKTEGKQLAALQEIISAREFPNYTKKWMAILR